MFDETPSESYPEQDCDICDGSMQVETEADRTAARIQKMIENGEIGA